eukprot:COSAG01_NODE_35768_length_526_cov_75.173302_2_plen_60_part_01
MYLLGCRHQGLVLFSLFCEQTPFLTGLFLTDPPPLGTGRAHSPLGLLGLRCKVVELRGAR